MAKASPAAPVSMHAAHLALAEWTRRSHRRARATRLHKNELAFMLQLRPRLRGTKPVRALEHHRSSLGVNLRARDQRVRVYRLRQLVRRCQPRLSVGVVHAKEAAAAASRNAVMVLDVGIDARGA